MKHDDCIGVVINELFTDDSFVFSKSTKILTESWKSLARDLDDESEEDMKDIRQRILMNGLHIASLQAWRPWAKVPLQLLFKAASEEGRTCLDGTYKSTLDVWATNFKNKINSGSTCGIKDNTHWITAAQGTVHPLLKVRKQTS